MSLHLKDNEDFNNGWKRNVKEECQSALNQLIHNAVSDPHDTIHETRKSYKKVRSALRLVRPHIDYYKQENIFFRDEARKISDIRDATSIVEALDLLKEEFDSRLYQDTFQSLRKQLLDRREKMAERLLNQEELLKDMAKNLERKIKEIDGRHIDIKDFKPIGKGMKKVYKRGWKALHKADESRSTEDFHQWRKRAKYLRYHFRLLERIWPNVIDELEVELHDITDFVGMDHDLAVLLKVVEEENLDFRDEASKQTFLGLLNHKREQLQQHAILKGRKWYVDNPDDFTKRMEVYWNTHMEKISDDHLSSQKSLKV